MKVLMFGWEFPPHISGGLGTASHGLAHALVDEGIDVLFVVPKLSGQEASATVKMISASEVEIPDRPLSPVLTDLNTNQVVTRISESKKTELTAYSDVKTTVEVISPYNNYDYGDDRYEIRKWNYQFSATAQPVLENEEEINFLKSNIQSLESNPGTRHQFSGSYGRNLMREVDLYSKVAEVIATENDFDIIHAHDWISFPAGIAAKKISGKPLVVHVHATEFDRSGENVNEAVFNFEREGMMAADKVLAVSRWTRQIIINRYGIDEDKVEVVYNGIVARENRTNPDLLPSGGHLVTFLGRITHQKGPYYFVEAAKLVLEKFPDARFVVAGAGDLLPAMIEHVAESRISNRFHFTGFVKGADLERIWSRSSVYVMPSVSEPFGLTPLEAVQSGIPVIISKQSGVSEIMHHALKIDFWDVRMLASTICSVLQYKALSEELKVNSEQEIGTINWSRSARKINNLYHELTNRKEEYKNDRSVFSNSSAPTTTGV